VAKQKLNNLEDEALTLEREQYAQWMRDLRPELKHIKRKQQIKRMNSFGYEMKPAEPSKKVEPHDQMKKRSKSPAQEGEPHVGQVSKDDHLVKVQKADLQEQTEQPFNPLLLPREQKEKSQIESMIDRTNVVTEKLITTVQSYDDL
jgi:hypothetical protein